MTQSPTEMPVRPDPAKIIVPRKHGQVLVEPGMGELAGALGESFYHQGLEPIAGFEHKLFVIRFMARREFWTALSEHAKAIGLPLEGLPPAEDRWVITGHQVEFYHAGVWAKVVAADELARQSTAVGHPAHAFDILVDHDVVDHMGFDVPQQDGELWKRVGVHWAEAPVVSADGIRAPDVKRFEQWDAELAQHPQSQTDAMAFFMAGLRGFLGENNGDVGYVPWMSQARNKFERALGMRVHHVPTSLVCAGQAWQMFVKAWMENADAWTAVYNKHLAAYRQRQGIKNDHHPMPDLARARTSEGVSYELPFWSYKAGEARQRLFVLKTADGSYDPVDFASVHIRPRALTLTMFVRLFLADLFIHGIGGALYDQITDGILAELFGVTPPYACVSAAWLLPLGQPLEDLGDIAELKSRRHHLLHNPQQAIDPFTALKADVAELILERKMLLGQIAESLAASRKDRAAREQRREWFRRVHGVNVALHLKAPQLLARLDAELAAAEKAQEQNKVLLWREYFFGLHTMESLQKFIARVRAG